MKTPALQLTGLHHVSALSAHIGRTHDFFTRVLGMRPVIKTVNQDEPTMYHLFFGDGVGSPGSDMTVFDMPRAAPERPGNNSISLTTFRVSGEPTFAYWAESPVPEEHQIRGLGYTVVTVPTHQPTQHFLTEGLGLRHDHTYPVADAPHYLVHVYTIGDGGAHAEVHVVVRDDLPRARYGAGGVHHVALRVPDAQHIEDWAARLSALGYMNSGVVERFYFTSVYVREPNHVLFELATDGPGFEVDGPLDGERLKLPPFLEPRRAEIEAKLKPLGAPPSV
ncbi:MAG: ring-cleaving dioxygenase [Gemmatimonadetes bacterium]|nr:ring-cleaving dioxygenase [Gemmatimonadota bacterium]